MAQRVEWRRLMRYHAPYLAAGLSLIVPGLGQLRNREHAKGIAILCITVGIWLWMAMATVGPGYFRSWLSQITTTILGL